MADPLPDDQRQAVFAALVAAQDDGLAVAASRELVASRYGLTPAQVQAIEREGLDSGWPPLGE
ncbi:MAG TPA: hypothetical protein VKE74_28670 [Gemmataceae bacterium]|nr:hypothetical protein [Gemmataceae bacterium]